MKDYKNPLIYLVDDNEVFRKMIDAFLKIKRLTRVKQFSSGEEMLEQLKTEKPFVVIQDYSLGQKKMNGLEIFNKAKSLRPDVEFIFLSGQNSIEVAVEAMKKGVYDYVLKDDFAKENLVQRIKYLIFQKNLILNNKLYKIVGIIFISALIITILICYLLGVRLTWYN